MGIPLHNQSQRHTTYRLNLPIVPMKVGKERRRAVYHPRYLEPRGRKPNERLRLEDEGNFAKIAGVLFPVCLSA